MDTIYFMDREVFEIELGRSTFLRALTENHILNIKHENQWWEIALMESMDNGNILVRYLDANDLENIKDLNPIYSTKHEYYLEANWTREDLIKIIDLGAFSDTILNLDINKMTPTKN